ncbi:MAG: DNA translocase FtsK, partial [Paracoccaceae bacterium]
LVRLMRRTLLATVIFYDRLMRLLGTGAAMSARTAQGLQEAHRARRDAKAEARAESLARYGEMAAMAEAPATASAASTAPAAAARTRAAVLRAEPRFAQADSDLDLDDDLTPQPGLFAKVPNMLRRIIDPSVDLEPELIETVPASTVWSTEAPSPEKVSARIADAVRARGLTPSLRSEPPLTKGQMPPASAAAEGEEPVLRTRFIDPATPSAMPQPAADWDRNAFANLDDELEEEDDFDAALASQVAEAMPPHAEGRRHVVHHSARKTTAPSRKATAEQQPSLRFEEAASDYELPPLSLLSNPSTVVRHQLSDEALEENARMLESVLDDYGVKGDIVSVRPGPVVTMYELEPAPGLKASRVIGLADDIARSMSALSARVSTVPGRSVIGIELPNVNREKVVLREILSARDFGDSNQRLPLALGKDISGQPIVANLAKMPHLLIAGTTGSGKSVAINTMILSLLYKLSPEECRLIMIDPKMLELSVYDGIPHLLSPVVTDPKKAVVALKWVVGEMEERYRKMSKMGVRNIDGYNGRVREALANGEMFKRTVQTGFDEETGDPIFETEEFEPKTIPYIVVIVDEMADLMMVAGKEIEACIQRLAQMARASGIHLIMA